MDISTLIDELFKLFGMAALAGVMFVVRSFLAKMKFEVKEDSLDAIQRLVAKAILYAEEKAANAVKQGLKISSEEKMAMAVDFVTSRSNLTVSKAEEAIVSELPLMRLGALANSVPKA